MYREGQGNKGPSSGGGGFDQRAKASKLRAGSTKAVDHTHIIARVLASYETAAKRSEKNAAGRALYELAKDNPHPDLWTVDELPTYAARKKDGTVSYRPNTEARTTAVVKVDGFNHYVNLNENNEHAAKLAEVWRGEAPSKFEGVYRFTQQFMRYLAMVYTSLSPAFVLSNFFRYVQTATFNLTSTEIADLKVQTLKKVPSSLAGIRSASRGDKTHEFAKWYDGMRKAGGTTGWIQSYDDVETRHAAL